MLERAINLVYTYLRKHYALQQQCDIKEALRSLVDNEEYNYSVIDDNAVENYDKIQVLLSKINEKESIRKKKGVYYTPSDLVDFIVRSSFKALFGKLTAENISDINLDSLPYKALCTEKSVLDPTCGAGEFLLSALSLKFEVWTRQSKVSAREALKILSTIHGNDVNKESVIISQLRMLLCVLKWCPTISIKQVIEILGNNFTCADFVSQDNALMGSFHVIIGNPPYVEDSKSGLTLPTKYGNIYANVLVHSSRLLEKNGAMGFVIPLSFISTPRMNRLREELLDYLPEQFILNYADRPDCLFDSVHQKLCVLIGKNKKCSRRIFTSRYQYWYKEERNRLFSDTEVIKNNFLVEKIIPKLGNKMDLEIFSKIINIKHNESVYKLSREGQEAVYLNRRETFWMKAYRMFIDDPEYKVFRFSSKLEADYCYCLINSSLFWWYWIAVSDCWHVSKDLNGFMAPFNLIDLKASNLAEKLQRQLEATKVYVGTKQTEYEYKHRACLKEISEIDDFINEKFGLTDEESRYIKGYALRYRTSGGVK